MALEKAAKELWLLTGSWFAALKSRWFQVSAMMAGERRWSFSLRRCQGTERWKEAAPVGSRRRRGGAWAAVIHCPNCRFPKRQAQKSRSE